MAGFENVAWAPGQISYDLNDRAVKMLDPEAGTYAVSRSIHYGLCLAFEGIRFFVKRQGDKLFVVFLNLDHNINRFRDGISFNLDNQELTPSRHRLIELVLEYLSHPSLRWFMTAMALDGAQGYLRPFSLDHEQSIGVTFPANPQVRMVAARYSGYLGEPFHGVSVPWLVRAVATNGTGCLKLGINYLLSVKAVSEAKKILPGSGAALFLDDRPYDSLEQRQISEWDSSCCLFALKDGSVIKIPESPLILPSVTINGVCAILRQMGTTVNERHVTYGELVEWARQDKVATVVSVGTAGILNRCSTLLLVDNERQELGRIEADTNHPLFHRLDEVRNYYWEIYKETVQVPEGLPLNIYEIGPAA
ncbi:MAG: hypothetical protein HN348_17715 [Proteobacteria bacterium]|jgi:branched-chain amino acid aminotransferase|nr:hypothetical protein [Pseudomonadota bacterium]